MSTITLSCLIAEENPYKNSFSVDINTNKVKTIGYLKKAIKKELHPKFENVFPNDIKLWKHPVEMKKVHCTTTYRHKSGASLKRKILTGKMRRRSDLSFQSAMVKSDTVEIVTEYKVIQFSADKDLMSIIWTTKPKVDLIHMKAVFGLKTDDYNGLPLFDGDVKDTLKEIQSLVINELLRLHKTS
ncbi:hypothetical protein C1645_841445 [Glomus cerebriforme]|uniref:Crinkler effector protein N-terminal domain-containing protein n=1 Tax=Glomus cerebriforme TaxID=658196 RepID=A0A397S9Y8_9GLOM|nr:hypothetical protein C1645_841445 [Glomus cerebriforme]